LCSFRGDGLATAKKQEMTIAAAPGAAQSKWTKGSARARTGSCTTVTRLVSALGVPIAVAGSLRRLPSQATGASKGATTQLHRARVLEVRIQSPPAKSLLRTRFLMGMGFRNAVFRSYGAQPIAGPSSSPTIRPSRRSCWGSGGSPLSWTASCGRCASALSRTPSARRSAASQCRRVTAEAAGPYFLSAR